MARAWKLFWNRKTIMKKILLGLLTVLAFWASAETIRIEPARRECVIVLPAEANFCLTYAAKELSYHLEKMTGVKVETITEPTPVPAGAFVFSLGETAVASAAGLTSAGLAYNHARLHGDQNQLLLVGNDSGKRIADLLVQSCGTLFAVYDLLEFENGCRWLWPGELGECIPRQAAFQFEAGRREIEPKLKFFFWRQLWGVRHQWPTPTSYEEFMNAEIAWLLRHRSNRDLSEQHYPHAFEGWAAKYLKTHPEFFNLLPDGTRRSSPLYWGGQDKYISMCTGSPAFRRQVVLDWLENYNPDIPRINLKSNDTSLQCTCDYCMADDQSPIPTEVRRARAAERYQKGDARWYEELGSMTRRQIAFYQGVQQLADQIAPEKHAKFSGLIYANSSDAPEGAELGSRFQFSFCPPMYFPWTRAKIDLYKQRWEGWCKTGADLVIRPNFTLDGHCYPIAYAREVHECYTFAEPRSLKGSDFDSLTGMYAAQGLTLYTIARLQSSPNGLPFEEIVREYCSAFGAAAPEVRSYFERLAEISRGASAALESGRPEGGSWTLYYLAGHELFTPQRFAELDAILARAKAAVPVDSIEGRRVEFLRVGLENARLTAEAAAAYDRFQKSSDYIDFAQAVGALDGFRADHAHWLAFNIGYCVERENNSWPRGLAMQMTKDTVALPIDWPFRTDPEKQGEAQKWAAPDFDDSDWKKIPTDRPWEQSGYADYDGYGWYRLRVALPAKLPGEPVLLIGSADEACDVWINGEKVLHRPYPYQGNENSWNESFEVPFGKAARPGQENVIAIRVEDNVGLGGLTKRCFLKYVPLRSEAENLIRNADFSEGLAHWELVQRNGRSQAEAVQFDGRRAVTFRAVSPDPERRAFNKYANYAMLAQKFPGLEKGRRYVVTVEFRTSADFDGIMMVFCHSDVQRSRQSAANIQMDHNGKMLQWGTISKEFTAGMESGDLCLNYACNRGQLYFSRVSVTPVKDHESH
jgi:hypothetical protein